MSTRTFNRIPLVVPIRRNRDGFFTQAAFEGLHDSGNDVISNPLSFSDVENVYVDEGDILVSRHPFKTTDDINIIKQWIFGSIVLRLYKEENNFVLRCISQESISSKDRYEELSWELEEIPEIFCAQIEDKIYIWFNGTDFYCYNTAGSYFEDAKKYIYLPIHKQVTNDIESTLEDKNFLTEAYKKRYLYHAVSGVNFERLIGRKMSVGYLSGASSMPLYDITVKENQEQMLVYPYIPVGNDFYVDIVETPRANVTLRYNKTTGTISISFDGRIFRNLPKVDGIVGNPILTKDGKGIVVFTKKGLAKCRLVAQETADFVGPDRVLTWSTVPYLEKSIVSGESKATDTLNSTYIPIGHFITLDQFAYLVKINSIDKYIYAEWSHGMYGTVWASKLYGEEDPLLETLYDVVYEDNEGIFFLPSGISSNIYTPAVVGVFANKKHPKGLTIPDYNRAWLFPFFPTESLGKRLNSGDIVVTPFFTTVLGSFIPWTTWHKVYKLVDDRTIAISDTTVHSGDIVMLLPSHLELDTLIEVPYNRDGILYKGKMTAEAWYLSKLRGSRYIIQTDEPLVPLSAVKWSNYDKPVSYTAAEMTNLFGAFIKDISDPNDTTWGDIFAVWTSLPDSPIRSWSDRLWFPHAGNPMYSPPQTNFEFEQDIINVQIPKADYISRQNAFDISMIEAGLQGSDVYVKYNIKIAYCGSVGLIRPQDILADIEYTCVGQKDEILEPLSFISNYKFLGEDSSNYFKLSSDTNSVLTENYYYIDGKVLSLPNNGKLAELYNDTDRFITTGDRLVLEIDGYLQDRYIYKIKEGSIVTGQLLSGDIVLYTKVAGSSVTPKNTFKIEKLDGTTGTIKYGDLIRLTSQGGWQYPTTFTEWGQGTWEDLYPIYTINDELIYWQEGMMLPIGPVQLIGNAFLRRQVKPIAITDNGLWFMINGSLWTSTPSTVAILELDEWINADRDNTSSIQINNSIPDYLSTLNETYIAFNAVGGKNLLEITSVRRQDRDLLLYLPSSNEEQFAKEITNLHTLSENEMGIFTEDEIWYMSTIYTEKGINYTMPTKSKIPVGCKKGSDIITALDGKLILFTTYRGVAGLSPQDFIASTEQTISYLSDDIQKTYIEFYKEASIKICSYKYWMLFYRYKDNKILLFDTRNGSWWKWSTPYPIIDMYVDPTLSAIFQVDLDDESSLYGVDYKFVDTQTYNTYEDDIYDNSLCNDVVANSDIEWSFTSQRINFGQANNYKQVKAIILNALGDDIQTTKLSTKAFRDLYHPEKSLVSELRVNDIRTFVQKLNIPHVINFQYKIEKDDNDEQSQIKFNSLTIKYEIKEKVK